MKKTITILALMAILAGLFVMPVAAGGPKPPSGLIAVDMDPYYKSLSGEAAFAEIQADTIAAMPELAEAASSSADSGGSAAGVGDVEFLYADGWQEFTLRALGDNAEIWVANDLSYCLDDPRPSDIVTQEQIEYLLAEFNGNIYPSNTTYFGYTNDRDGTGGSWDYDLSLIHI